jgi:hypothetical protein
MCNAPGVKDVVKPPGATVKKHLNGAAPENYKLFAGHTGSEQFMFYCTCVWFLQPCLLVLWPVATGWQLRSYHPVAPWAGFANVASSLAHWAKYEPRSLQQMVDVLLALMVCALLLVEACIVMGVGGGEPLVTPTEAGLLSAGMTCFLVAGELDAFHGVHSKQLGFTTGHITGTWLHFALRFIGFALGLVTTGTPVRINGEGEAAAWFATIAWCAAAQFAHACACLAVARWLRLDDRRATLTEHLLGLAASIAGAWAFTWRLPYLLSLA